jgi:hypothetical protein
MIARIEVKGQRLLAFNLAPGILSSVTHIEPV